MDEETKNYDARRFVVGSINTSPAVDLGEVGHDSSTEIYSRTDITVTMAAAPLNSCQVVVEFLHTNE